MNLRIGQGFDVHAFAENRKLILGGVEIPYSKGLLGHSDADVLIHAIMDALIGALALGDIGVLFPDTDPQFKDISSMLLLKNIMKIVNEDKIYRVINCDCTVILQRPKLLPYREEMIKNLSNLLGIQPSEMSVKFTTTEHLGFTGRGEGIAAQAMILLSKGI